MDRSMWISLTSRIRLVFIVFHLVMLAMVIAVFMSPPQQSAVQITECGVMTTEGDTSQ